MSVSDPFLKRPLLTLVVSMLIVLAGLVSLSGLEIENLPPIAPTRVSVSATYPGASAEVVEQGVTDLLERQLNSLERLDTLTSTSTANGARVNLRFRSGSGELNQINVQNEAALVTRRLPQPVSRQGLRVRRSGNDLLMVLSFSDSSGNYDRAFISGWLERQVRDPLQRLDGVGEVVLFGSSDLAYRIWLDPTQLTRFDLTIDEVNQALRRENVLAALGQVGDAPAPLDQQYTLPLRMEGRLRSQSELENLLIKPLGGGNSVRLRDLGRVSLGEERYGSVARNLQGEPTVAVGIFQRDGTNALQVSQAIKAELERASLDFPPGLEIQYIVDVADNVRESIDQAFDALRDAVLLVFATLLLGLGNWRLALITAVAVPVALVGSFTLLKLSGGTINTLTLFGLVLATGVVVDDAIVVSEDIGRRIDMGEPPRLAASHAMQELSGAVIATSLVLIVVFLPVLMIPGSLGRLYQPIAVVISSTILFSTINALTFTPVASAVLLGRKLPPPASWILKLQRQLARSSDWLAHLHQPYERALDWVMRRRRGALAVLAAGLLVTGLGLRALPTGFIPQEDVGQIRGVLLLPEGASLARSEAAMRKLQEVVAQEPLIRTGNFYAGRSFGDSAPNKGIFFLRLKYLSKRGTSQSNSTTAVLEQLGPKLRQALGGEGQVFLSQPLPVRGFGSEGGVSLNLLDVSGGAMSLQQFSDEAEAFSKAAMATGKFRRVGSRFSANSPALQVVPDRERMAAVGVNLQELVSAIGDSFGSTYVNDTFEDGRVRRILVQLEGDERNRPEDVLRLTVRNSDGDLIPLSTLVTLKPTTGPTSITHAELSRSISIRAALKPGVSSGEAIALLEQVQANRNSPATELLFTGLSREEQQAGGGTWQLFGLGLVVVYLVLAALYESAIDPLVILITVPLALLGVVVGLASRGLFLDVYGQVGVLVLISLAAKNGILIVEFANQRVKEGHPVSLAIREASSLRLRPILLTGVSSLAGFLPLLLARGAGAASRISIGTVVFSGLLLSTALSLFVLPVIYELIKSWETGDRRKLG